MSCSGISKRGPSGAGACRIDPDHYRARVEVEDESHHVLAKRVEQGTTSRLIKGSRRHFEVCLGAMIQFRFPGSWVKLADNNQAARGTAMARQINVVASIFMALIIGSGLASASRAQDCPRGDLDKAYCDRDGDLVADTPAQTVNPSTLIFAYTPVEDPAVYTKVWDGFIKHMEKVTGKKVVFFPVQSNAAEVEAMRSGRLHIAGFNTGSNPIAVNCAGFVPFAIMAGKDGTFGYEMEIIVPADSAIKTPADIKGKKLAFTAPTSNSGFKA